jgi:hypothetical protein
MKRTITAKLHLNKETLHTLSERDLKTVAERVAGGDTGRSDCFCGTETLSDGSCGTWRCC